MAVRTDAIERALHSYVLQVEDLAGEGVVSREGSAVIVTDPRERLLKYRSLIRAPGCELRSNKVPRGWILVYRAERGILDRLLTPAFRASEILEISIRRGHTMNLGVRRARIAALVAPLDRFLERAALLCLKVRVSEVSVSEALHGYFGNPSLRRVCSVRPFSVESCLILGLSVLTSLKFS